MSQLPVLTAKHYFPPVESAHPSGIVAIGGDLSPERLILAYRLGIFPWFDAGSPYIWWSLDPRFVLFTKDFTLSKRQERAIRSANFLITANHAFDAVIEHCARVKRNFPYGYDCKEKNTEQDDPTWITDDMLVAYKHLHRMHYAHSIEVWQAYAQQDDYEQKDYGQEDYEQNSIVCARNEVSLAPNGFSVDKMSPHNRNSPIAHADTATIQKSSKNHALTNSGINDSMASCGSLEPYCMHKNGTTYQLVGGLYGVCMGQVFCGESMFHLVPEASRAAFAHLVKAMKVAQMPLIDCQQRTPHIARMGGQEIMRKEYIQILENGIKHVGSGPSPTFLR